MSGIIPMNAAAKNVSGLMTVSRSGFLVADDTSVFWKRWSPPFFEGALAGDVLTPGGNLRVVAVRGSEASKSEIKNALNNPDSSELPIFELVPGLEEPLLKVSRLALAAGVIYLIAGVLFGVAMPTALRYVALSYEGAVDTRHLLERKKVIDDYKVLKKNDIDEGTKKFVSDMNAAKEGSK